MSEQDAHSNRSIVRVAVCGEVRAGKSSMLNALFRENILADNLGRDERPPVFAEYNEETGIQFLLENQEVLDTIEEVDAQDESPIESIQLWHDQEDLAAFEFVEVPLTSAEQLTEGQIALVRSADIMIWVTIASQAWRLTEKTIIDELRDACPRHCILAISRAEKLRKKADQTKLMDRMVRETTDYFAERIFVDNSKKKIEAMSKSADTWSGSGAAEIVTLLHEMSDKLHIEKQKAAEEEAAADEKFAEAQAAAETEGEVEVEPEVESEVIDTPEEEVAVEAQDTTAEEDALPSPAEEDAASDNIFKSTIEPFADGAGDSAFVGLHVAHEDEDCIAVKGDPETCLRIRDACRDLEAKWLSAFDAESLDSNDFGVVMHTASRSLHYQTVSEQISIFMMSTCSELNRGAAQNKHSQMCKALADVA